MNQSSARSQGRRSRRRPSGPWGLPPARSIATAMVRVSPCANARCQSGGVRKPCQGTSRWSGPGPPVPQRV
ncbi:hypothetical protein ACFQXA_13700 [Nocardiopsis composta]